MKLHHNESMIIDKIKKLFALSNSPIEEEAASALNKAKELLVKYDIEYEKIEETKENISEKVLLKSKDILDWHYKLIECITSSTFTEAIVETEESNKTVIIIGRKINIISAANLYNYLEKTIRRVSNKYDIVVRDLDSFRYGMVEKIQQRLKKSENEYINTEEKGLIPLIDENTKKENINYLKNKYGKINNRKYNNSVDENSYGLGKIVGEKISLNDQIIDNE